MSLMAAPSGVSAPAGHLFRDYRARGTAIKAPPPLRGSMTEFGELGIAQYHIARLFNVTPRTIRRWRDGDRRIPHGVGIVLNLVAAGAVTVAQIEQAAAGMNGRQDEPEGLRPSFGISAKPPAPLPAAPTPEQPVRTEAAALDGVLRWVSLVSLIAMPSHVVTSRSAGDRRGRKRPTS
jgi:hypothetical protein